MSQNWEPPRSLRWWVGIGMPLAVLPIVGPSVDWHEAVRVAGILSAIFLPLMTSLLTTPRLDRVAESLLLVAAPIGASMWGDGLTWPLIAVGVISLLATGAMLLFRRDLLAVCCIMLGWMTSWVAWFFGVFGDWPSAALWGGGLSLAVVAVYFGGRLIQRCSWRQEVPPALYAAAVPAGCVFWGAGVEYEFAAFLGFVVAAAGVAVAIITKDWVNEEP